MGIPHVHTASYHLVDGLRLAGERGGALTGGLDEFYGRALPAPPARIGEAEFVRASQLYGRFAHVVDDAGEAVFPREPSWSENEPEITHDCSISGCL